MTDYVKSTNFTSKDSLPSGNALKIVKGTEFDVEFNNIATAVGTKADSATVTSSLALKADTTAVNTALDLKAPLASPALTGTPTAPTASVNTSTTQLATTAFVVAQIADDAPTKTGGNATGTWNIDISGNANTASTVTTITTAQVLNATAGASAGAVGTYVFARLGADLAFGATVAGSSLTPTSAAYSVYKGSAAGDTATLSVGAALSGTWRAMGTQTASASSGITDPIIYGATLFLRIS